MMRAALLARTGLVGLFLALLSGCAATRPMADAHTELADPFAIPFADSTDAEWVADTTLAEPMPAAQPKPRKKKPAAIGPSPGGPSPGAPSPGGSAAEAAAPVAEAAPGVAPPPVGEPVAPEPKPPQLTVRLSAEEMARLDERIQADLARAERALAALKELPLTGEPADQLAAARRFVTDARAARAARDYVRGAELAEKARVLAEAVRATAIK